MVLLAESRSSNWTSIAEQEVTRHAQTVRINLPPCYAILSTRRRMRTIACPTFVLFGWGWPNICS